MTQKTDNSRRDGPSVAIMVPLSDRENLTLEEEISLRHLRHYLGHYDKYLVIPRGMRARQAGFEVKEFNRRFFGSPDAHKRLLLSQTLYERFASYDYLLTYHLDALVFSDQLADWCEAGYDYIGAPWIPCSDLPWCEEPAVGNSGFCLRSIDSALKVLDSNRFTVDPDEYWRRLTHGRSALSRTINLPRRYLKRFRTFNGIRRHAARTKTNDDRFWSRYATHYYPGFRIAPVDRALEFAFEAAPRKCLEMNDGRLPFGCHAWSTYDRQFWEPFLLK